MNTEYEWVTREPMCKHDDECVCQWVFTLRGYGWLGDKTDHPEAVSFASETVPCTEMKSLDEYPPDVIEKMSEALRKIRKWDEVLDKDLYQQLTPVSVVENWSNEELKIVDPAQNPDN